ncbi:MAG: hypothetical protein V2A77_09045 [Pseudomonadota bacterium]
MSLASRVKNLEAVQPPEPLVIRITCYAYPPTPEEERYLEAEKQRRLRAGENLVVIHWSGREARRLGAPAQAPQAEDNPPKLIFKRRGS